MATKAKDVAVKRKPGRPKKDLRRHNRGVVGNKGGTGRPQWKPDVMMVDDGRGALRKQTQEEAWADARALIRHCAAVGMPVEKMGQFLHPKIEGEATVRKHFQWEIDNGEWQANLQVSGVAFRMATSGRHESSTWRWLERRLPGFQQKADVNLGGPLQIQLVPGDAT